MADPQSIAGWLNLCKQHERAARLLANDKTAAAQGHFHAGIAVECALKAYIWHKERFNEWPSRQKRPDLYVHDLRKLKKIAEIYVEPNHPNAPNWHVALDWNRNQGYDPKPMPRTVALAMVEAAFGENGVITWLRQQLKNAT